jgi:predicted MFS family arabinose efflux permease
MLIVPVLWTAFFLVNFNIAMMIPLLPFMQRATGISPVQAGIILAAFPIMAPIGNLAIGPWIDRYGRKRFLVAGGLGSAVVFLATAASGHFVPLVLCRAAIGVCMPMLGASVFAAVSDYVRTEDRARISGYVTTAAPVAFLLSMSLGVVLSGYLTWQVPLVLTAVVGVGVAVGASRLPPTPADALATGPVNLARYRDQVLAFSLRGATRRLLVAHFCWASAMFTFLGLYPTWVMQHGLVDRGPGAIGLMLFVGEVGGCLGAFYSSRFPRVPSRPLGFPALAGLVTAGIVLMVPLGRDNAVFQAVAYAGYAFGRDLMLALILGGAMGLVAPAQRGSLNATLNAVYQTGATLGVVASAALYGWRPDFLANAGVSAVVFVMAAVSLWSISTRTLPGGRA